KRRRRVRQRHRQRDGEHAPVRHRDVTPPRGYVHDDQRPRLKTRLNNQIGTTTMAPYKSHRPISRTVSKLKSNTERIHVTRRSTSANGVMSRKAMKAPTRSDRKASFTTTAPGDPPMNLCRLDIIFVLSP